jgi:hypothetical protein
MPASPQEWSPWSPPRVRRRSATRRWTRRWSGGLTFTDSNAVDRLLTAKAAATLERVPVELGGHAPFLAFRASDPATRGV